jgi:hypothetical protein
MDVDVQAAVSFLTTRGRVLDRRRLHLLLGDGDLRGVLAALDAHRNADGGYGWALEPDLRSPESQPVGAMHALEVLVEAAAADSASVDGPRVPALLDWLARHTLPDGGLPFALPVGDPVGCAPHWVAADPGTSSLQMTTQVAAQAHRLARHRPEVAASSWLAAATAHCLVAIEGLEGAPHAYELMFALRFLDAVADAVPQARAQAGSLARRLARHVPGDGPVPVAGGAGEVLHPLDLAPEPGAPSRALFTPAAIAADLARLAGQQQPDGGWSVGFPSSSPAAALEWRGYATVQALTVLRAG